MQNSHKQKYVCVGLDSDVAELPKGETQLSFNQKIIEATADLVAAYKPNIAFYEAEGVKGWETLKKTIAFIHEKAPQAMALLDAKRADIGNTSAAYAKAAFEDLSADAVTLNPYLGAEAIQPFLDYKEKLCFILCRTSNPGAKEFQDLLVGAHVAPSTGKAGGASPSRALRALDVDGEPLYLRVARHVATQWNKNKNCGLVVGATYPEELKKIREVAPDLPLLVPGVGSQGGDWKTTVEFGADKKGGGLLINLSRSVIFASHGADFADAARREILKYA